MLSNGLCNSSSSVREHTHERIVSPLAKLQQGNVRKKGHELLKTTHTHTHIPAYWDLRGPSWEPTLPGPAEIRMLSEQRYVCLHTWQ